MQSVIITVSGCRQHLTHRSKTSMVRWMITTIFQIERTDSRCVLYRTLKHLLTASSYFNCRPCKCWQISISWSRADRWANWWAEWWREWWAEWWREWWRESWAEWWREWSADYYTISSVYTDALLPTYDNFTTISCSAIDNTTNIARRSANVRTILSANVRTILSANVQTILSANVQTILSANVQTILSANVQTILSGEWWGEWRGQWWAEWWGESWAD